MTRDAFARHRLAAELRAELADVDPTPRVGPIARRFRDVPPVHDQAEIAAAAAQGSGSLGRDEVRRILDETVRRLGMPDK